MLSSGYFVLVYANAAHFPDFYQRYKDFVRSFQYPHPLVDLKEVTDYSYTDIRILLSTHLRNEKFVALYQVLVDLHK